MKTNKISQPNRNVTDIAIEVAKEIKNNIPIAATILLMSIGHEALITKLSNPKRK